MICRASGLLLSSLLLVYTDSHAADRVALVIGNGKYEHIGTLKNPPKDVRLVSDALEDVGFDVTTLVDASEDDMIDSIHAFSDKIDDAGEDTVGLFYFAGHGINYAGNNWLVPVDARVRRGPDIEREGVSARFVLSIMEEQKNLTNIIILDACRDNPFKDVATSSTRSLKVGMAAMQAPKGSFIAFSTAEGDVAYDGRGDYSPFAEAFAGQIRAPDITINSMMIKVNAKVGDLTKDMGSTDQIPWARYSLTEDFYFNKRATSGQQAGVPVRPTPLLDSYNPPQKSRETKESELWTDIKNSEDPDEYTVFLNKYPDGEFAALAKVRQAKFSKKPEPVLEKPKPQQTTNEPVAVTSRSADPELVALCRQFAGGDSGAFADCMDERAVGTDDFNMSGGNFQNGGGANQVMTSAATWYDDEYNQWQVSMMGDQFTASTFIMGTGQVSLQGASRGYDVGYQIYNEAGNQIGYGEGRIMDDSHINVTSYWANGAFMGSTAFHVNHPPQ